MAAAVAAAAAALLGACSTGDDEGSATTTTAGGEAVTTAPPDYEGDPDSPFCELLREVDTDSLLAGDADDPASVEEALQRLVDVLADASEVAPSPIADDVVLVAEGIAALDEGLAEVGYDFEALAASETGAEVTAAANDPIFTDAGVRLGAYRTQVCQL